MDCPRCFKERALDDRHRRTSATTGSDEARGCAACQGAWLTLDAAHRLIEGPFGPLAGLPRIDAGLAALRCPECQAMLDRRKVADIEIDVCAAHGVWFDHREVERVQAAARRPRGGELAAGAIIGAAVVTEVTTAIYAAGSQPGQRPVGTDAGVVGDAAEIVGDVGLTAIDVASSSVEVVGSAVVEGGAIEVVSAGAEAAGSGALELLAGLFEGLFS